MATTNQCLASLARLSLATPCRPLLQTPIPRFLAPAAIAQQARNASGRQSGNKKEKKKRRQFKAYRVDRLDNMQQFSLCDAIRYARAFEVGQNPTLVKYDLAVNLKTLKSGPVIKSRIRLPHPVRSDRRIGVICKENSALAIQARNAGAVAVGEESLFEIIRNGSMTFTSMICDQASADKLAKANLGRLLGPKGLMPSVRQKTITSNVLGLLREMAGQDNYREKAGVVRIAIGQLGFTPDMVAANVKAFVAQVKEDCATVGEQVNKEVHEVVLSTTHGPGFSLNGGFNPTEKGITPAMLQSPM
ncbi:ribosomal protein L1 [Cryphonectria parasitica EP155]|uniref:Ribosomal protein L1 n=1 Tax=Cryphonectria parasitica (strain ATCC 38755 / EP155) TaxID=660469 RepID=A0A9P4YDH9_CRYP1|nr:ribosomal protein L1 [Cryphonectria parasitica EP155]KAF3771358.1 ribosomal protein L1 [Cryphonectria parasitica EP155]